MKEYNHITTPGVVYGSCAKNHACIFGKIIQEPVGAGLAPVRDDARFRNNNMKILIDIRVRV